MLIRKKDEIVFIKLNIVELSKAKNIGVKIKVDFFFFIGVEYLPEHFKMTNCFT